MTLDSGYGSGTISVTAGGTVVTGVGTNFTAWVTGGYPLFAGGVLAPTQTVTDDTHIVLALPWPGATLVNAPYFIQNLSRAQLEFDVYRRNVRRLVATLAGATIMVQVPEEDDAPDPGLGDDGDFAVKVYGGSAGSAWQFWLKEGGVWVDKGAPVGLAWKAAWSSGSTYATNDITTRLGVLYIAIRNNTNAPPETSTADWQILLQGGNLFPLLWSDSDMPASGETILKFPVPVAITFPAGMAQSRAIADVAPTATAVFSLKKNGTEFATYSFAAGQTTATFSCPTATAFAPGDVYSEVAPGPRDATLFGVSTAKISYR